MLISIIFSVNDKIHIKTYGHDQIAINDTTRKDTLSEQLKTYIIILPPYDQIANRGISPNIFKYLERSLRKNKNILLPNNIIKTFKELNINYNMVFDRKYCNDIIDKMNPDIIIMSKLDLKIETGNMISDKWDFEIKVYNPRKNKQQVILKGQDLLDSEIKKLIYDSNRELFDKILSLK